MQIYVVKPGDSLYSIAKMFGISLHMIMETNGLERPNDLVVGQSILILTPEITHTIRPGETIEYIAAQHNKSVNQIYRNNPYLNARPSLIVGDELVISYTDKPTTQILVNGFLYPNINHELLTNTLPFLTYISPFTYSFSYDGNLTPLRDEFILRRAYEYGVRPLMTLSSIDDDGRFSPELSDALLNSVEMQQKLMGQVLNTLQTRQYSGVIVDFERILPKNRDIYTNFITNIHKFLNDNGYILYVAVAPKISAEQFGALYTAHDYEGLGEASDGVIIMTYEWGYIYSQPMAVAPIQKVEKVVQYAVSAIPESKIFLGIPNYGYDWTLPFDEKTSRARVIGNEEAIQIAITQNAAISFDEESQSPYFRYYVNNKEHEVWFQDARSSNAKFDLVKKYNLAGVSYWTIMKKSHPEWQLLNATFQINQ